MQKMTIIIIMEPNDMNLKSASKQNKADRIMFSVLIFLVWFGGFFSLFPVVVLFNLIYQDQKQQKELSLTLEQTDLTFSIFRFLVCIHVIVIFFLYFLKIWCNLIFSPSISYLKHFHFIFVVVTQSLFCYIN